MDSIAAAAISATTPIAAPVTAAGIRCTAVWRRSRVLRCAGQGRSAHGSGARIVPTARVRIGGRGHGPLIPPAIAVAALAPGGTFAFQVPGNFDAPSHVLSAY